MCSFPPFPDRGVDLYLHRLPALRPFYSEYPGFAEQNRQLAYELSLSDKQMEAQKSRYALLSEMASALRKQRHDLRHQLAVIQSFNNNGERDKLNAYLQELLANIPSNEVQQLCDNEVVNAVAYYYYDLAKSRASKIFPSS